jgi:glutaredoxin
MERPVVYYKPGCPFGVRLRVALTTRRIAHTSVRFRDDEHGAAQVRAVNGGWEVSPTVHVNGRWLTNPRWYDVLRAANGQLAEVADSRTGRSTRSVRSQG